MTHRSILLETALLGSLFLLAGRRKEIIANIMFVTVLLTRVLHAFILNTVNTHTDKAIIPKTCASRDIAYETQITAFLPTARKRYQLSNSFFINLFFFFFILWHLHPPLVPPALEVPRPRRIHTISSRKKSLIYIEAVVRKLDIAPLRHSVERPGDTHVVVPNTHNYTGRDSPSEFRRRRR